ncbi:MAG: hypothetical protein LJE69_00515, partial [Thiohalocapsa sp.]|uniref:hypothetical protein n=1 Tax=Thiohalocapsa sp. TaxID=2497641 RepID=UPI0025EF3851
MRLPVFSAQPVERLRELLRLIEQVHDRTTAVEILESPLRYYVQGTQRVEEQEVRALLRETSTGEPIMQTFIDRYIEQGRQQGRQEGRQEGEAAVQLSQIEDKFGPPSEAIRQRITTADAETLLRWSKRI